MDPQGHHAGQDLVRRRDVREAALDRPGSEAVDLDAFRHHDGAVLMPAERPVRGRCLVEQNGPDGSSVVAKHRACDPADRAGAIQKGPQRDDPLKPDAGAIRGEGGGQVVEATQSRWLQDGADTLNPVALERHRFRP